MDNFSFNPSMLPALILGPSPAPAPISRPDTNELLKKFWRSIGSDLRDASKEISTTLLSSVLVEGMDAEIDGDGDLLMAFQGDAVEEHGAMIGLSVCHGEDGVLNLTLQLTARNRNAFVALLDFAAAGLAAMDTHALQNGWQRS